MYFIGPLGNEFSRVRHELEIGKRRREVLADMAERIDLDDVSLLISAILQAEHFGVPIAQVLRSQSTTLKIRRNQLIREQIQKAPVNMVIPIAIFILPAILIIILGPLVIQFAKGNIF